MAFELPALPYAYNALEPHIDEETMRLHHGKHHQGYTNNLNAALTNSAWEGKSIEVILSDLSVLPETIRAAVRNNGGGYANHCLFWETMAPNAGENQLIRLHKRSKQLSAVLHSSKNFFKKQQPPNSALVGDGWLWTGTKNSKYTALQIKIPLTCRVTLRSWDWTCGNTRTTKSTDPHAQSMRHIGGMW